MTTSYQKSRKDLIHARAFTTISTRNEGASRLRRPTIFRPSSSHSESLSFGNRGLIFKSPEASRKIEDNTDARMVQAVPSDFAGYSKPSEAVERLLTKRKNEHENAVDDMKNELSAAHEKCANELREQSERIKADIERIRKNVDESQDKIQNTDLSTVSGENLQATWDSITSLLNEEKRKIDDFYEDLRDIEGNRQFRAKQVMQKYYEIFHRIAHVSPFEIQVFSEKEIQDYNEEVLKNFKLYEDLRLRMLVIADSRSKELQNWLKDVNDRRRGDICLEKIRRIIRKQESLKNQEAIFIHDPDENSIRGEFNSKLEFIEATIGKWQSDIVIFDESSVNDCSKELAETVGELKSSIVKLVALYKSKLQKLYNKYENEVGRIKEDKNCVLDNDVKMLDEAVHSLKNHYKIISANFEDLCNRCSKTIDDTIEEFSRFLRAFNSTWKKQAARLLDLQDNVGRMVDDLSMKSKKSVDELEKKLNNYNQQMRQATSEDKMKQQLPIIYKTLDLIDEKHKLTYEDEYKVIKNYLETVFKEVPKIIKEFDDILQSHGYQNSSPGDANDSETDQAQNEPNFIKQQLMLCQNLVPAVLNWKLTLMNEIVEFRDKFPKIIEEAAESWEQIIITQRSDVLEIKLKTNSERREQVLENIYELRVQEIDGHKRSLENHEVEVNQVLKETSDRLEEFLREQKQFLQSCEENIVEKSEQFAAAKTTTELNRLKKEIQGIKQDYKNETQRKVDAHKKDLDHALDSSTNKNEEFLQKIILFKDGGNFSSDEVKSYRKTLISLGKTISQLRAANLIKMDKIIGELDGTMETLVKTIIEKSNANMRELTFYEDIEKAMRKCAVIIERQVDRLLEDDTILINAVIDRIEDSTTVLSEASITKITEMLNTLDSRFDSLIVAFPAGKDTRKETVQSNKKRSTGDKKKKEKPSRKTVDYSNLFVGSEEFKSQEHGFTATTMNTMIKTIEGIQAEAKKFFGTSSKRPETEASYHEFMKDSLQRFVNYREQLERLWAQEVTDLLAAARLLDESIYKCILSTLDDFHDRRIKETRKKFGKKHNSLDELMRVWSTRRDDILASFKLNNGNIATRESLDELIDTVVRKEQEMQNTVIEKFIEFKRDLEEISASYEISLLEVANPLIKIVRKSDDRAKRQRLRNLLNERKISSSTASTEISDALDISKKSNRRSIKKKRKLSLRRDENYDIEMPLKKLIEKARRMYNSVIDEAEVTVNSFVKSGEEFKQRWKTNMEIVAEIYEITL